MSVLADLERDMKRYKEMVVTGEALSRLKKNKDFKRVVLKYFLAEKVDDLIKQKCHPDLQHEKEQAYIDKGIIATGYLASFFEQVEEMGKLAKEKLIYCEEHKDEIITEEQEDY